MGLPSGTAGFSSAFKCHLCPLLFNWLTLRSRQAAASKPRLIHELGGTAKRLQTFLLWQKILRKISDWPSWVTLSIPTPITMARKMSQAYIPNLFLRLGWGVLTRKKVHGRKEGSRTDKNNEQLSLYITLPSNPIALIWAIKCLWEE